jgi:hypothetical protein
VTFVILGIVFPWLDNALWWVLYHVFGYCFTCTLWRKSVVFATHRPVNNMCSIPVLSKRVNILHVSSEFVWYNRKFVIQRNERLRAFLVWYRLCQRYKVPSVLRVYVAKKIFMKGARHLFLKKELPERFLRRYVLSFLNPHDFQVLALAYGEIKRPINWPKFIYRCAKYGHLNLLLWAMGKGNKVKLNRICFIAAQYGQMHVLNQFYSAPETSKEVRLMIGEFAARGGQIKLIEQLFDGEWYDHFFKAAVMRGQLEFVKHMSFIPSACLRDGVLIAARYGHVEVMKWCLAHSDFTIHYDPLELLQNILVGGHVHVLEWVVKTLHFDLLCWGTINWIVSYLIQYDHVKMTEYMIREFPGLILKFDNAHQFYLYREKQAVSLIKKFRRAVAQHKLKK